MNQRIYIRDNLGLLWFYEDGRIRLLTSDATTGNGYNCDSLEDGIRLLNILGYIFPTTDDEIPEST